MAIKCDAVVAAATAHHVLIYRPIIGGQYTLT